MAGDIMYQHTQVIFPVQIPPRSLVFLFQAPPFQTTFGYAGDLDTLGPLGRGHTPLNPPGPVPVMIPGFNAPNHAATILP